MWRQREKPLDKCPRHACRRSGRCRSPLPHLQCSRLFMTAEEARYALAARIEQLHRAYLAAHPEEVSSPPKTAEELERRKVEMYKALKQRREEEARGASFDPAERRRRSLEYKPYEPRIPPLPRNKIAKAN